MTHAHLGLRLPGDNGTGQASDDPDVPAQRSGASTRASSRTVDSEEGATAGTAASAKGKKPARRKDTTLPDIPPAAPIPAPAAAPPARAPTVQAAAAAPAPAQASLPVAPPPVATQDGQPVPRAQAMPRAAPAGQVNQPPQDLGQMLRDARLRALNLQAELQAREAQFKARETQWMAMLQQQAVDGITVQLPQTAAAPDPPPARTIDHRVRTGAADRATTFSMIAPEGVVGAAERAATLTATAKDAPPAIEIGFMVDPMDKRTFFYPLVLALGRRCWARREPFIFLCRPFILPKCCALSSRCPPLLFAVCRGRNAVAVLLSPLAACHEATEGGFICRARKPEWHA